MRISDWSSDVCSSDLLARGQTGIELGEIVVLEGRQALFRHRVANHLELLLEQAFQLFAALGLARQVGLGLGTGRSEEHTSELQSLMRTSYAVFCLKKKKTHNQLTSNRSDK